jgi:hypothetical protein
LARGVHQGERFFLALFAFSQPRDRFFVAAIDEQLKAAEAFERENLSVSYNCRRLQQGFVIFRRNISFIIPQFQMRAAMRAGIRLRVKTPVMRIVIFFLARRTHPELFHRLEQKFFERFVSALHFDKYALRRI